MPDSLVIMQILNFQLYIYISDFCLLIDILWFQLYKIDKIKDQENQNEIKS